MHICNPLPIHTMVEGWIYTLTFISTTFVHLYQLKILNECVCVRERERERERELE